jgi:hypothetical protein
MLALDGHRRHGQGQEAHDDQHAGDEEAEVVGATTPKLVAP